MKFKFKTLEELQNRYPINSVIIEWDKDEVKYVTIYDEVELAYYKTLYSKIEPVSGVMYQYKATFKKHMEARVVGYIYDGEFWYPAYLNSDGWQPYN